MPNMMPLAEALREAAEKFTRRILLLGNGFSIRCWPEFKYPSLAEAANFSDWPEGKPILTEKCDGNFETAIRHFESEPEKAKKMREKFLQTIGAVHPERRRGNDERKKIDEERYEASRNLLCRFIALKECGDVDNKCGNPKNFGIFTLNYDLLLQWALFGNKGEHLLPHHHVSDHFGGNYGGKRYSKSGYVIWRKKDYSEASLFYLHGALHYWEENDGGPEDGIRKMRWRGKEKPLVERIQDSLKADSQNGETSLPLTVAEGSSGGKMRKIEERKNLPNLGYLHWCLENLRERTSKQDGCVFIYGWSLGEKEDGHIFDALARGHFSGLYVSRHNGDEGILKRVDRLQEKRAAHGGPPLQVKFFDAADLDDPNMGL